MSEYLEIDENKLNEKMYRRSWLDLTAAVYFVRFVLKEYEGLANSN